MHGQQLNSIRDGRRHKRIYTTDEMIAALLICEQKYKVATKDNYIKLEKVNLNIPHHQTIIRRFSTWNKAKEAAGLSTTIGYNLGRFSEDDCLDALDRVHKILGHFPSYVEYDAHRRATDPAAVTIRFKFGTWMRAWSCLR